VPGPAPKHPSERRRRNPVPTTVELPAEGRQGDPPAWPLSKPTKSELAVWGELWKTPQSVAWERLGWFRTIGRYARLVTKAEKPGASAFINSECRQMEDRIGLTPMSMLRLRWEIVRDEVSEQREVSSAPRERLKAVDLAVAKKP
jgi:hypothetical protein